MQVATIAAPPQLQMEQSSGRKESDEADNEGWGNWQAQPKATPTVWHGSINQSIKRAAPAWRDYTQPMQTHSKLEIIMLSIEEMDEGHILDLMDKTCAWRMSFKAYRRIHK